MNIEPGLTFHTCRRIQVQEAFVACAKKARAEKKEGGKNNSKVQEYLASKVTSKVITVSRPVHMTDHSVTFHVEPRLRTCKNAVESWPSDDRPMDAGSGRPMH